MDRIKPKESSQGPPPPKPKLIYGTSVDYQERAKRLRLMGSAPDHDLNPFNAPTVNAIENMFERVMAIAKSSSPAPAPASARRHLNPFGYSSRPFSSSARTYERHQTKPEENDTIAFTSSRLHHEPSNQDYLPSSSGSHVPSTTTLQGAHHASQPIPSVWSTSLTRPSTGDVSEQPTGYRYMHPPADAATTILTRPATTIRLTQDEPRHQKQPIQQPLQRAPLHTQADITPQRVPMKRPLSPEPFVSKEVRASSDHEDMVEILSSDDEEEMPSEDDEVHYSYSEEDELEEDEDEDEESEQDADDQHVILDSDDDDKEERRSMEPRWVDELDKAHLNEWELRRQSLVQALQETERTPEDSQGEEEELVELEDDEPVEEYDDDEAVSRDSQVSENDDGEDVGHNMSQEETRRQRNELNRQLRGRMTMGLGMLGAPGYGRRHPLGPLEPLELQDDDEEDIVEGRASDEDDAESVGQYDEGREAYSSDEERNYSQEEEYEEAYGDEGEEHALSDAEPESSPSLVQNPQQPASPFMHLQEHLRLLESVVPPHEWRDSSSNNVVSLLDSDEEEEEAVEGDEEEYPQDENEAEFNDPEQEELEHEGDSQDDEVESGGHLLGEEHDQTNSTALDTWSDNQHTYRDNFDNSTGSYIAEADSVIHTSGEDIAQQQHRAHDVEDLQQLQRLHEQPHAFVSSSSSSELGVPQDLISVNVQINVETYSSQETEQDEQGEVINKSVESGAIQSSSSPLQEEIRSQPGSPERDYEAEEQSHSLDFDEGLNSHDTADSIDSPRFGYTLNTHSPVDVVMTETKDSQEVSSVPEFETGVNANTDQEQPEEDLPSAGLNDTGDFKDVRRMAEEDSEPFTEVHPAQIEQVMDATVTTELQDNSVLASIDNARAKEAIDALLKQQELQKIIDIAEDQQSPPAFFEDPVTQPSSVRTVLLDRLHSIAQEENIDLQPASTFAEPFTIPSYTPSSYIQHSTPVGSLAAPTTLLTESTLSSDPTRTTMEEPSDLSPIQPRKTRLTRMSTMAQTVRDGQAFMDQLASRLNPASSKNNSADSQSVEPSSSPSAKRSNASSPHTRTAANMVLLVKEAREFCAGGPSRVGSSTVDEETVRDMVEETGTGVGQAVVAQEDRVSTAGSQPSTPHKSGVVDLVAELVIQSKVKGHHALRVNPASPGRSPVVNATLSRSSSLEPSVTSPMGTSGPQYPLTQPPPPPSPLAPSSAFTFGQGSPSKSALESPSVGFGFGTSFLTSSKERRVSVGSASSSSRTSPRKSSGLGLGQFTLDPKDEEKEEEQEATGVESVQGKESEDQVDQDEEMSVGNVEGADEIEGEEDEVEGDDSEAEGDSESVTTTSEAPPTTAGQGKKKARKITGRPRRPPTATVQAKRLRRRELFWQKKQQALEPSSPSAQEEKKD